MSTWTERSAFNDFKKKRAEEKREMVRKTAGRREFLRTRAQRRKQGLSGRPQLTLPWEGGPL